MTKQEEIRSSRDEEKIKLQREVDDLKVKLAESRVTVRCRARATRGWLALNRIFDALNDYQRDAKEVENPGAEAGKVNRSQDLVGRFGPFEWPGILIVPIDE
jgi:hypothetical protein